MIKIRYFMFLGFITLIFTGCGSNYKLAPQVQQGQKVMYQDGVETIISKKSRANVVVRSSTNTYSSENRPTIIVSVLNKTNRSFNFSTENVQVYVDGKAHKVFSHNELVKKVKTEQTWATIATAIGGAADAYSASTAGSSYTTTYNQYGYPTTSYNYNYADAQQARYAASARTDAEMQNINSQANTSLANLQATVLKKTTIPPRGTHGGYVSFENITEPVKSHEVKVLINTAGEQHMFVFKHFKVK